MVVSCSGVSSTGVNGFVGGVSSVVDSSSTGVNCFVAGVSSSIGTLTFVDNSFVTDVSSSVGISTMGDNREILSGDEIFILCICVSGSGAGAGSGADCGCSGLFTFASSLPFSGFFPSHNVGLSFFRLYPFGHFFLPSANGITSRFTGA